MKKVCLSFIVLFLFSGCEQGSYKYLGCYWDMPETAEELDDGRILFKSTGEERSSSFSYIEKYNGEGGGRYFDLESNFKNGPLEINKYIINDLITIDEANSYIITRDGYSGSVQVVNADYSKLLSYCDE